MLPMKSILVRRLPWASSPVCQQRGAEEAIDGSVAGHTLLRDGSGSPARNGRELSQKLQHGIWLAFREAGRAERSDIEACGFAVEDLFGKQLPEGG